MHANKQIVNSEYVFPNLKCYQTFFVKSVFNTFFTGRFNSIQYLALTVKQLYETKQKFSNI